MSVVVLAAMAGFLIFLMGLLLGSGDPALDHWLDYVDLSDMVSGVVIFAMTCILLLPAQVRFRF